MAINPSVVEARRILGTGIVLTGLVVLSIGLILGLELPKYLREKRLARLCITSTSSRDFNDWVNDGNRSRYNYLRVWNFTNLDSFLHQNATPKFELIGPYVFREREKKMNVRFHNGVIDYKSWKWQEFEANLTQSLCPCCLLNDSLTLINPAYLQKVDAFDDAFHFYLSLIPSLMTRTFSNSSHHFDVWLQKGDVDFKRVILSDRRRLHGSHSLYLNLHRALANASSFGADVLRSKQQWDVCAAHFRQILSPPNNDEAGVTLNDVVHLNTSMNILHIIHRLMNDSSAQSKSGQRKQQNVGVEPKCGLVFYLLQLAATSLVNWILIKPILSSFFCQQNGGDCFLDDVSASANINVSTAYVAAIVNYTVYYLPRLLSVQQAKLSTFTRLDLKSAALGFYVDSFSLLQTDVKTVDLNKHPSSVSFVKGFLEHYETEVEMDLYAPAVTLKTCLLNKSRHDNLKYKEFSSRQGSVKQSSFESNNASNVEIGGYQDYKIPPANRIYSCAKSSPFYKQFQMFLPQLWRVATFSLTGFAEYQSVTLQRFIVKSETLEDMLSTKDVTGYLSWSSPANSIFNDSFLLADVRDFAGFGDKTYPEVLLEAITGKIWVTASNVGVYVGLKKNMLNVTCLDLISKLANLTEKPLLYYSCFSSSEPSQMTIHSFNHEIHLFLKASCGGLISLSIIGSVIILTGIGVAIAVVDRPTYRITPTQPNHFNSDVATIS